MGGMYSFFIITFFLYRIVFERLECLPSSFLTLVLCWMSGDATEFIIWSPEVRLFFFFFFLLWSTSSKHTVYDIIPGIRNGECIARHSID